MKKLLTLLLSLALVFTLAACSNMDGDVQESEPEAELVDTRLEESRAVPEETRPDEEPDNGDPEAKAEDVGQPETEVQQTAAEQEQQSNSAAEPGKTLVVYISHTNTTATVADQITSAIDADVFVIVPTDAYPGNYNDHLDVAQQELNDDARPAIQSNVPNMDEYDTILLGYPIWWGYAPRPVATFLESHDLSGKTIAPFCTSGSSGMGRSAHEIAQLAPGAEMASGLSITSSNTGNAENLVRDWLAGLGLL